MEAYQGINPLKSPALRQLRGFLRQHREVWAHGAPDLEAFERELHTHVTALERELLAEELRRYDVDTEAIRVNGVVCKQAMTAPEEYLTTAGVVTIERRLYRPPGHNSRHVCPLELQAGIVAGFYTPAAARQAAYVVAHLPPATGAQLLGELGGMQPSASSLGRLPKDLSARWETHRPEWEAGLRTLERVPSAAVTLSVSLDGVLAPLRTPQPETAARPSPDKQPKGPKGYQEVGCPVPSTSRRHPVGHLPGTLAEYHDAVRT